MCRTVFESSCTTKYLERVPGKFEADTACEKLPVEICGPGCTLEEGVEECHDKVVASVMEVPEEVCDLNPQKTCHSATKLVPKLEPVKECTQVMKETCQLTFSKPERLKKPFTTKWCLDESDVAVGEAERSSKKLENPAQPLNIYISGIVESAELSQDLKLNEKQITIQSEQLTQKIEDNLAPKKIAAYISFDPELIYKSEEDIDEYTEIKENDLNVKDLFPERVDLFDIQFLRQNSGIPIIEVGNAEEMIGPKRQERDLLSERLYQTRFY